MGMGGKWISISIKWEAGVRGGKGANGFLCFYMWLVFCGE
jgi:hypothetical protein